MMRGLSSLNRVVIAGLLGSLVVAADANAQQGFGFQGNGAGNFMGGGFINPTWPQGYGSSAFLSGTANGFGFGGSNITGSPGFIGVGNFGGYNTPAYTSPVVYGGYWGGYGGYGGWGGWGGGWGGWGGWGGYGGWGGWGGGYGYGPYGGIGMTPFDQAAYRMQIMNLTQSRYNYNNAQATQAYAAAQLYQQQAMSTAISNYKQVQQYYDKKSTKSTSYAVDPRSGKSVSRGLLLSASGAILWPASAPRTDDIKAAQAGAEAAVKKVFDQYEAKGTATVQATVDAKVALDTYGGQALPKVQATDRNAARQLWAFLLDLEQILDAMATPGSK